MCFQESTVENRPFTMIELELVLITCFYYCFFSLVIVYRSKVLHFVKKKISLNESIDGGLNNKGEHNVRDQPNVE